VKRVLAAALLLLVSAGAAALVAEGIVRWLRPGLVAGPAPVGNPFWRHDPDLGWSHTPGEKGRYARPEFDHAVSINSMGFRDIERDHPSAPSPPRVAVLGDSFAWGHGVEDGEIFTRLMDERLTEAEVWNLGVSAYSTDQELLLLRKMGRRLRVRLVLVMVSRNDFAGNASETYGAYPKPRFVDEGGMLALRNVPVPRPGRSTRALTWIRRHSAFVNGLLWSLGAGPVVRGRPLVGREEQIRLTLRLLDAMVEEARAIGSSTAIGLVPSVAHVYFGKIPQIERRRFEAVRAWGRERGIPVLDLVPPFRRAFETSRTWHHYVQDKHWNAAGHRLAARALVPLLEPLLAEPPASTP
jgi:lysophospholipase L1-like esterase